MIRLLTLGLLVTFWSCPALKVECEEPAGSKTLKQVFSDSDEPLRNLLKTLKQKEHKILLKALKATELVEKLDGDGPFTIFAPTDRAFQSLPEGMLESLFEPFRQEELHDVMLYHMAPQKWLMKDISKASSVETALDKKTIAVKTKGKAVRLDNALVVEKDILCTNGVIHVIDAVLIPDPKPTDANSGGQR